MLNNYNFIASVDNGWYSFSPSGHAFYSNTDEMKIHGRKAFLTYLKENNASALVKPLCYGENELISYHN